MLYYMSKYKILLLSTHDSHLGGHAWAEMQNYDPDKFDTKLVTLYSVHNSSEYAIIKNYKLYRLLDAFFRLIYNIFVFRRFKKIAYDKYCFFRVNTAPITARQILKKYNNGLPDIIMLHWFDGFISPKTLYKLYQKSGAKIYIALTDEFPLTGGCHYPCDCLGYKSGCDNCPALFSNKKIVGQLFDNKLFYLSKIPKVIVSNTYGIQKAKDSLIYKENTSFVNDYGGVNLSFDNDLLKNRNFFNIQADKFVVMFGAININEERKGFNILLQALQYVSNKIDSSIIALIPGNININIPTIKNIDFKFLGLLPFEDLCRSFSAANVFISPSIADTGPMMVKYAIACGTPVVSFPIGYSLDFVKHKETGYLAEYGDPWDLANGIFFFYENQHRFQEFRNRCLKLNEIACQHSPYQERLL